MSADGPSGVLEVEVAGRRRLFGAEDLPVSLGSAAGADVLLDGVPGLIRIGRLGEVFFVQADRGTRNLRVGGVTVTGSRELKDGDVIAFDRARLECSIVAGTLRVKGSTLVTAGDT